MCAAGTPHREELEVRPAPRSEKVPDTVSLCVAYEHEFAEHASLSQQLVRLSGLQKRKSLRDQRLDLVLLKEIEQNNQVPSKPCWS